MPTTCSRQSVPPAKSTSPPKSHRVRSSTSKLRQGKKTCSPKVQAQGVRFEPPNEEHSEEDESGTAPIAQEQQGPSTSDPTVESEPQNVDPKDDFGLQQLMNTAAFNNVAEQLTSNATGSNTPMEVDPAQPSTVESANQPKVRRPLGSAGRHYNLQNEMGLKSNRKLYNQIQRETRWTINQASLPLISFKRQDPQAIFAITQAMKERFPFLGRFVRPAIWPVIEMIKLLLRNRRAYHKVMGIPPPGTVTNMQMEADMEI